MPLFDPGTVVLAILVGSLALLVTDALRYDLVALLVVLALVLTRCLTAEEAFAGFASEPVVVIACLALFGHALSRWGVGEVLVDRFLGGRRGEGGPGDAALVLRITLISAVLASVMSDVAVVAILIPMVAGLARARQIPISRLLMPVSFGAFLGDLLLVIGSAKNLAVNGVLAQSGVRPFWMFEFTHYGAVLLAVGALYMAGPGRRLLPRPRPGRSLAERYEVPRFVTEVLVEPASTLINRSVADLDLERQYGISVLGIVRAGREGALLAPGPYNRIRRGDALVLQGEPDAIVRMRAELGLRQLESAGEGESRLASGDVELAEAVVAAGSKLAGRTLAEEEFHARTNLNVLGVSRHGELLAGRLPHTRLLVGDSLLVQGHRRDLERARRERELIVLGRFVPPMMGRGAWISVALLVSLIAAAASGLLPLGVAALAGAVGLVLLRCVPAADVYQEIDWVVIVLIGGMLALGRAFEKHHLAGGLAEWVAGFGESASNPYVLLGLVLVVSTALAQTTTSIGSAVILTPVALSLAEHAGLSERAFVMAVLTGTNCAFLSPIAHPANAMVVGPGEYRFRDFLRFGGPLTVLLLLVALVLLPVLWPLSP